MLYKCKEKIEAEMEGKSLEEDEREQLNLLCKEDKELHMEMVILKKASVGSISHDPVKNSV